LCAIEMSENRIWTYEPAGRDVWGRRVYAAYFLGEFAGYRYRRTNQEVRKLQKELGNRIGIRRWVDCPAELVVTKNGREVQWALDLH